jgi:hypothetical protein
MRTPAARALHLGLFGLGVVLYVLFVLPRWWVLTGDIPRTLATAGRIAAGIPIALAAWPVMQLLQAGLRSTPRPPELALRLRAWSGVLHVVAGVLILLAAIAEIWLRLQVGAPWLFGVYGAAAALAVLGFLGLYLSFVAEQPPGAPKPAKIKKAKPVREDAAKKTTTKPTTKRGRKAGKPAGQQTETVDTDSAETLIEETVAGETVAETVVIAGDTVVVDEAAEVDGDDTAAEDPAASEFAQSTRGLRNKRPSGKIRRLRR